MCVCMVLKENQTLSMQGYDKTTAKKHLLVFALAAPVAAFFSYFGLTKVSDRMSELDCSQVSHFCCYICQKK